MFTGFEERNQSRVTLVNVDPEALRILVDYVYTSEVEVTEENVQVSRINTKYFVRYTSSSTRKN